MIGKPSLGTPTQRRRLAQSMRALQVGDQSSESIYSKVSLKSPHPDGSDIQLAMVSLPRPIFDPESEEGCESVLIKVLGFCLNYRDRAIVFDIKNDQKVVIGSEFVGVVEAVGVLVNDFLPGQRVMADMGWPVPRHPGALPGVPTNAASSEYLILNKASLALVPDKMPSSHAASFALSAQTAFSMVRRAEIENGENVLVTAGSSATSLALIQALKIRGALITATTSNEHNAKDLYGLGVQNVICNPMNNDGRKALADVARPTKGFQAIFDPFADVHLPWLCRATAFFGRYVTCGVADQGWPIDRSYSQPESNLAEMLTVLVAKNIRLIGNCLGLREDLNAALSAYSAGEYCPIVAGEFEEGRLLQFIEHSFGHRGRAGKAVFLYNQELIL